MPKLLSKRFRRSGGGRLVSVESSDLVKCREKARGHLGNYLGEGLSKPGNRNIWSSCKQTQACVRSKIPGDLVAAVITLIGHRMHRFSWIRHRHVFKVTRNSSGLHTYSGFSRDSLGKKWYLSKSDMPPEKAP